MKKRLVRFKAELKHNENVVAKQSFKYRRGTLLRTAQRDAIKHFLESGELDEHMEENTLQNGDTYSLCITPTLIVDLNESSNLDLDD